MPNKRKRKYGLETELTKYDASPISDKISDIPRSFKRLLQANEFKKKKAFDKSELKDSSQVMLAICLLFFIN